MPAEAPASSAIAAGPRRKPCGAGHPYPATLDSGAKSDVAPGPSRSALVPTHAIWTSMRGLTVPMAAPQPFRRGDQHGHHLVSAGGERVEGLGLGVLEGYISGRTASAKWAKTPASRVSVLASVTVALAKSLTRCGCTTTSAREAAASAATKECSSPLEASCTKATGRSSCIWTTSAAIPVSSFLGPATPFQSFVDAEDQRPVAPIQVLEQKHQQDAGYPTGRPHRPIEYLMVAGVVAWSLRPMRATPRPRCAGPGTVWRPPARVETSARSGW